MASAACAGAVPVRHVLQTPSRFRAAAAARAAHHARHVAAVAAREGVAKKLNYVAPVDPVIPNWNLYDFEYLGEISVGTPEQSFEVCVAVARSIVQLDAASRSRDCAAPERIRLSQLRNRATTYLRQPARLRSSIHRHSLTPYFRPLLLQRLRHGL
jgi:hypothetical protein